MKRVTIVVLALAAALVVTSTAGASGSYAGITKPVAIEKAKRGLLALELAFNGSTPKQLATYRRWLDAHPPSARKSACKGIKAWRIKWAGGDAVFVNRKGLVTACFYR